MCCTFVALSGFAPGDITIFADMKVANAALQTSPPSAKVLLTTKIGSNLNIPV